MPDSLPGGAPITIDTDKWYYLQASYLDTGGNTQVGYLTSVAENAATAWWDYRVLQPTPSTKFKLHLQEDGWYKWEVEDRWGNDGHYLP